MCVPLRKNIQLWFARLKFEKTPFSGQILLIGSDFWAFYGVSGANIRGFGRGADPVGPHDLPHKTVVAQIEQQEEAASNLFRATR